MVTISPPKIGLNIFWNGNKKYPIDTQGSKKN